MNAPLPANQGLVTGMSNFDYHANPAISKSQLADLLEEPPLNFWRRHIDPSRPPREETAGQRAGTLLHTLVLEPETFAERYAVGPMVSRNTKEWRAFEAEHPHLDLIKPDELQEGRRQAESLRTHPEVAQLLTSGIAEASIFWTDPVTGEQCRCRPDWMHETQDGWICLDLKTGPANPRLFASQIARMSYDVQDAMYSEGIQIATGKPVLAFVFGVVQTDAAVMSSCNMLHDEDRAAGAKKYRAALNLYAKCKAENDWPGYEGINLLHLPVWAMGNNLEE